jgi:predicted nucleotidyltransferase
VDVGAQGRRRWVFRPFSVYATDTVQTDFTAEIERVVSLIVTEAHPVRVIPFGSVARGDMTTGSNIDLLVVMPDGAHGPHTMQRLYARVRGVTVPFDVLVATTADLEAPCDALGLACRDALREDRELYAA